MAAAGDGVTDVDDQVNDALKALANPIRRQMLGWLRDPRANFPAGQGAADLDEYGVCVSQLQEKAGLAQSTVSSYMASLERADLVIGARVGKWTHYRRNEERIARLIEVLDQTL